MVNAAIQSELSSYLNQMPIERQREVLEFARSLAATRPKGQPGMEFLKYAGEIDQADLNCMSQVIGRDCERIDDNSW